MQILFRHPEQRRNREMVHFMTQSRIDHAWVLFFARKHSEDAEGMAESLGTVHFDANQDRNKTSATKGTVRPLSVLLS